MCPERMRHPYPGLRAFEPDEADLFFGREEHVDALLQRLSASHFVAVVGESGAGKSSLVRAGLLPALEAGFVVEAGSDWRIGVMRPGGSPLVALADALLAPGVLSPAGSAPNQDFALAELRRGPLGIVQLVRDAHLGERCNVLVVVDQFEELFRYCREPAQKDQANVFVELLLHAARQRQVPLFVVLTMRSDFVGDCARFRGLPEALNDNQYLTPRLTREQIAAAIREPARVCGGLVENELTDQLCNAVGDDQDQLPLLQHLLMRVWDEARLQARPSPGADGRRPPWPRLTVELSTLIGGLRSALDKHAQQIYESLPPDGRALACAMFKCLTDPSSQRRDLRRDALVSEVSAVADVPVDAVIAVADEFRAAGRHMLMPPPAVALDAGTRLDISHESLLRHWSALGEWARDERIYARGFERLREEAQRESNGQGELLAGRDLARAQDWVKHARPTPAWAQRYAPTGELEETLAFIQKSEAEAGRRKDEEQRAVRREAAARRDRLFLATALGAFLLVAGVAGVIYDLWQRAENGRIEAEDQRTEADKQRARAQELTTEVQQQNQLVETHNVFVQTQNSELRKALTEREAALTEAHSSKLVANALLALETEDDPSLALLLAQQAVVEGRADPRAVGALRRALAAHVPAGLTDFTVARSRHYVPDKGKSAWLDFALSPASVSPRRDIAIVPSGNDAIIWSMASGQPAAPVLRGHTNIIGSASFSPDGKLAVTTSADTTVRLWNVDTGQMVQRLDHGAIVNNAVFTPDGFLIVMGDDSRADVWTVGDYTAPRCRLQASGNFVTASSSRDRRLLVTVTHVSRTWFAQVWNVSREGCPREAVPSVDSLKGLRWASFSPYGPWLGLVMSNGEITLLDTSNWTPIKKIEASYQKIPPSYPGDVEDTRTDLPPPLAWSSDGMYVAAAAGDNSVRIAAIGKPVRSVTLSGHTGRITSVAFHPTDHVLLTSSKDRTARVWKLRPDYSEGEVLVLRGHKDTVGSAAFSHDGSFVVTAGDDGSTRVWRPVFAIGETRQPGVAAAWYSPDGKRIWTYGFDATPSRGTRELWVSELAADTLSQLNDVSRVPVGSARSLGSTIVDNGEKGSFIVRDARNPWSPRMLTGGGATGISGTSPRGRFLYATVKGSAIRWDANTPNAVPEPITAPAGDRDRGCALKAVSDAGQLAWYCANTDRILIARDGRGTVRIERRDATDVEVMQFSRSSRLLAAQLEDHTVEIYDTSTGRIQTTLRGNNAPITGIDFSADERFLVSTSRDLTVRVWDITTGVQFATVRAKGVYTVRNPRFSPDGLSILVVALDRLLVWRCYACGSERVLLEEIRSRHVRRTLTSEEEQRYGIASRELNASGEERAQHSHAELQARR